jgi:hypothetical protein
MAKETRVEEIIENIGYEPIDDRCIIVSYAPANLSDKIVKFFSSEFYVFQMCKNEIVLVPFGKYTMSLKKEATLEIPYDSIKSVKIDENGLDYNIIITTNSDEITLTAQQKELSDWRDTSILTKGASGFGKNWHKDNLDGTLKALRDLKN